MTKPPRRVLLKLSGEVFSKEGKGSGLHLRTLHALAGHMKDVIHHDIQLAVVTGGGNIWRYRDNTASGIERTVISCDQQYRYLDSLISLVSRHAMVTVFARLLVLMGPSI